MGDARFRDQARAFLIWRCASAVEWTCTYGDISRVTGLTVPTIQRICLKRGWKTYRGRDKSDLESMHNLPVDRFIATNHRLAY